MATRLSMLPAIGQTTKANTFRQYAVTFDDADAIDSLRAVLDGLIIFELFDLRTVFSDRELFALDALIPYEPGNVVMTNAEWNMVFAFCGSLAIRQEQERDCLLPGKTKLTFYKHLMRLIRSEITQITFTF